MAIKKISGSSWIYLLQLMEYARGSKLRDRQASLQMGNYVCDVESSSYDHQQRGFLMLFGPALT